MGKMVVGAGAEARATSARIEGMDRPAVATLRASIAREPADGDGPRHVMTRAEAELVARYGTLDACESDLVPAMFEPPDGAFLVARTVDEPDPVGGVGLRRAGPASGEVKRLWVDPAWRRSGLGRALMAALEDEARALDFSDLVLATGERQPEAVALYESSGWERQTHDAEGRLLPTWYLGFAKTLA
jgi:GNAT superfamily N-acetyltransferase